MAFSAGVRLGPYQILAPLGAGGMGEVYRATDTKLGRDVAIKVLPAEVAQDPERLQRFDREAHLLASLNHPHIAAIHGLEEADGQPFLVLELVDGEDLRTRLERGPIPVDEALEIAEQVAEALEEAHGKGVVHRDLKPANVMLTPDGKVKVLDFGLAKAWAGDAAEGTSSSASMSESPTLAHSGTQAGVILGTAAYMSPEQARGKPVDKRGDVWAFGVVLWEMLTGRVLFAGETVTDIIAAVVKEDPDLDALPAGTPPGVRRLLGRCLKKDPRKRLPDIGAARLELEEVLAGADEEAGSPGTAGDGTEVRRLGRQRAVLGLLALVSAGIAAFAIFLHFNRVPEGRPAAHFVLDLPDRLSPSWFSLPMVSPKGHHVVFAGSVSNVASRRLWIRTLSAPGPRELPGTEGAGPRPFWSPDGEWLAFVADGELRKLELAGGSVQRICALPSRRFLGGTWNEEGTIVLATGEGGVTLFSVAATGGDAQALTTLDDSRGETQHSFPWFLPDGTHFLFAVRSSQEEATGLYVASLDAPAERRRLLPGYGRAVYASGHLLFVQSGVLLAQPMDLGSLELTGEPAALAREVGHQATVPGRGFFSAASGEVLAYSEIETVRRSRLEWLNRQGEHLGTVAEANAYGQIALAPDEKWIAVEILEEKNLDLWVIDVSRGVPSRFTSDPGLDIDPVWSPDSQELVFGSNREGRRRIFRKGRQGQSAAPLPRAKGGEGEGPVAPEGWTRDGKTLLYRTINGKTLWALPLEEEGDAEMVLDLGFVLDEPQISPDGQWLAYNAQGTGAWEVYVRPFRRPGETVRVSVDGGGQPKWRGDGKELFYLSPAGELMAVSVQVAATGLVLSRPTVLFRGEVEFSATVDTYAVSADGQRFLVKHPLGEDPGGRIHVITNWTSLLEQR